MKVQTKDMIATTTLRAALYGVGSPFRRVFVNEETGELHFSLYDEKYIRQDYCAEIYHIPRQGEKGQ